MIRIQSLDVENYRGFPSLHIDFSDRFTCIAGVNGSGKSSILNAISLCMSWIIARSKSPSGKGWSVDRQLDIHNSARSHPARNGFIHARFTFMDKDISMKQTFSPQGGKTDASDYSALAAVFDYVNEHVQVHPSPFSLPVLVYYPTNRAVQDIPVRPRTHPFDQFSTYENALDSHVRFKDFFVWYRDREAMENARKNELRDFDYKDIVLESVRRAIYQFLPGYERLHVQYAPQLMMIAKDGVEVPVNVLSDGEKCLLSLAGDLARRLALANPDAANPLQGGGIVLIDEIDLHLHPSWQRKIVPLLMDTFPNCQFIITTHSPQVLGEIQRGSVFLLNNGEITPADQSFGLSTEAVLLRLMSDGTEVLTVNKEVRAELDRIARLVDEEQFSEARQALQRLEGRLGGSTPDTDGLSAIITTLDSGTEE